MKKLFTLACLLVFFAVGSSVAHAQCTPDANLTAPDGGLTGFNFSPADLGSINLGQALPSTVVSAVLLERIDTNITLPVGSGDVSIVFFKYDFSADSAQISGFHPGLANPLSTLGSTPAAVSGVVFPDTNTAANDSKVCFTLSGTPTAAGDSSLTILAKVDGFVSVVVGGVFPINTTFQLSSPPSTIGGLPFSTIIGLLPAGLSTLVSERLVPFRTQLNVVNTASVSASLANEIGLTVAPNPGSINSQISFNLAKAGNVNITVFDMTGRVINTITDGTLAAGSHSFSVCADCNPAPGIYFVKVAVDGVSTTSKIVLN